MRFEKYIWRPIYNLKQGIKNLIKWFPIIWRDSDWDYAYLLTIIAFKMENMAEHMDNSPWQGANTPSYTRSLRVCAELSKRLRDDDYLSSQIETVDVDDNFEVSDPAKLRRLFKERDALIEADKELFCKLYKKYLCKWWD